MDDGNFCQVLFDVIVDIGMHIGYEFNGSASLKRLFYTDESGVYPNKFGVKDDNIFHIFLNYFLEVM